MKRYNPLRVFGELKEKRERGRREARLMRAYKELYETENGKLVLHDLIHQSGLYQNLTGEYDASYQLGAQSIANHIIQRLRVTDKGLRQIEFALAAQEQAETNERKG